MIRGWRAALQTPVPRLGSAPPPTLGRRAARSQRAPADSSSSHGRRSVRILIGWHSAARCSGRASLASDSFHFCILISMFYRLMRRRNENRIDATRSQCRSKLFTASGRGT